MKMKQGVTYQLFLCLFIHQLNVQCQYCDKVEGCNSPSEPPIFKADNHAADINKAIINDPQLDDPFYLIPVDQRPQILWWYDNIFPHTSNDIQCSLGSCTVTKDRNELKNPLTRGIIFYGSSFMANDLPLPRLPYHEWGIFHEESPKNNWMFSSELGISIFNHTATFRRESDYPLSTQFIKDTRDWIDSKYFVSTKEKNRLQKDEGLAPAVFVQRDCNPPSDRDFYIKELMKYIKIDSYGSCVNNRKMPDEVDGFHKLSSQEYYHFLAKYKFQIAFENCVCPDYMTEKVFRPLEIGSVPVYFGSTKIRDFMPTDKAVIVVNDFKSPKDLAYYLKELNAKDYLYNEYLKHRQTGILTNNEVKKAIERQKWKIPNKGSKYNFGYYMFSGFSCHICDKLHERNNRLREHIHNPSVPVLPPKVGQYNHMGCPMPKPILPYSSRTNGYDRIFNYGAIEGQALADMIHANESDSRNWGKYLHIKTDKYP